jgi:hypothetical protein
MAITASDVKVGGVYVTANNQERKVTDITPDGRVVFDARSGNSGQWGTGSTLANPPTMEKFVEGCERVVSLPKP